MLKRTLFVSSSLLFGGIGLTAAVDPDFRQALPTSSRGLIRFTRTSYTVFLTAIDYKFRLLNQFKDFDPIARDVDKKRLKEYKAALDECNVRAAQRLYDLAIAHGGVYNKFAQYVSTMNHVLPKKAIQIIAPLQDKAKQISASEAKDAIALELKKLNVDFQDFFTEFEENAIASASLAQVHRAKIERNGVVQKVAVKIQYPIVRQLYEGDLATLKFLAGVLGRLFPQLEYTWLIPEFEQNMTFELDFNQEAKNGLRLQQMFKKQGNDDVYVPTPFLDCSTDKMLVMEFIDGWRVDNLEMNTKHNIDPLEIANTMSRSFGDMIHVFGFANCDPHHGNLLVRERTISASNQEKSASFWSMITSWLPFFGKSTPKGNHQLVILDHGMVRRLSPKFRREYCRLWKSLLLQDTDLGMKSMQAMGVPIRSKDFELLTMSLMMAKPSREEIDRLKQDIEKVSLQEVNDFLKKLPRDLLFVMRSSNLVRSINKSLGGSGRQRFRTMGKSAVRGMLICNTEVPDFNSEEELNAFSLDKGKINLPVEFELTPKTIRRSVSEYWELFRLNLSLTVIDFYASLRLAEHFDDVLDEEEIGLMD